VNVSYRRPRLDEARDIAALHVLCWREAYREIVPAAILDAADVDKQTQSWTRNLENTEGLTLAAYDGNAAVGFIFAGPATEILFDGMDGHIAAIYIRQTHHRLGIGRRLMREAASWWHARGGRSLSLGVLADNLSAKLFYESLGGRLVKTGTFNWHGFDLPDAIYVFEDLPQLVRAE
jgi:ribosomal protein S18 acetylase RimI-like enzyme